MVIVTVAEVLSAAHTLEKMSKIYDIKEPQFGEWSASDLRGEIPHIEEIERQAAVRRVVAVEVEKQVFAGLDLLDAVTTVLAGYELHPVEEP